MGYDRGGQTDFYGRIVTAGFVTGILVTLRDQPCLRSNHAQALLQATCREIHTMKTYEKARRAQKRTDQLQAQLNAHFGAAAGRIIEATTRERAQIDPIFAMLSDDDQHAIVVRQLARIHKLKKSAAPLKSLSVQELEAMLLLRLQRRGNLVIRLAPHTFAVLQSQREGATARLIALSTNNEEQHKFIAMARSVHNFNVEIVASSADITAL